MWLRFLLNHWFIHRLCTAHLIWLGEMDDCIHTQYNSQIHRLVLWSACFFVILLSEQCFGYIITTWVFVSVCVRRIVSEAEILPSLQAHAYVCLPNNGFHTALFENICHRFIWEKKIRQQFFPHTKFTFSRSLHLARATMRNMFVIIPSEERVYTWLQFHFVVVQRFAQNRNANLSPKQRGFSYFLSERRHHRILSVV